MCATYNIVKFTHQSIFSFWQHKALLASHHMPRFHQTRLCSVTATISSAVLDNVCFSTSGAIVPEPLSTRLCGKYTQSPFLTEEDSSHVKLQRAD